MRIRPAWSHDELFCQRSVLMGILKPLTEGTGVPVILRMGEFGRSAETLALLTEIVCRFSEPLQAYVGMAHRLFLSNHSISERYNLSH
jgi:hypothetical protein